MAGNKQVPLTINGVQVGTATVDENGLIMGDVWVDQGERVKIFGEISGLSIYGGEL